MDDDVAPPHQPILIDWPTRPPREPRRRLTAARLVGATGKVFIATSILLFGFIAYQLWGTGLQQARSQDRLRDRFAAHVSGPLATVPGPTTTVLAGDAAATSASTSASTSATTVAPLATTGATPATTGAPPASAALGSATPPEASLRPGDPVARLVIPKIGVDQVVVSGVGVDELKKGPGHYPDTPLPGQVGNAAIAGHRSTFGAPFARVDELQRDDEIQVTGLDGTRFVYRVVDSRVVEPTDVAVIANTPDAELTLTSCWPRFSAAKRIVVRALLDASAGAPAVPPVTTVPPATTSLAPAPSTSVATADAPAVGAGTTIAAATRPATTLPGATSASADAFRRSWWADDAAWGHVMGWGAALSAVAFGAWRLSRRTNNWVGAAVGIVPFVVLLYFFYENVARLLPPNI